MCISRSQATWRNSAQSTWSCHWRFWRDFHIHFIFLCFLASHQRRESDSEGRTLFTKKQLIEMNLYFERPASELIFITRSMYWKLHREIRSKNGKIGGKSPSKIEKQSIKIIQLTKSGEFIKEWSSAHEANRKLGISQSSICGCIKGKRKTAGGFVWRYKWFFYFVVSFMSWC